MKENSTEVSANLERAETNLHAAMDLIEDQYFDIAAARAYYSAFYAASALLLSADLDTNIAGSSR